MECTDKHSLIERLCSSTNTSDACHCLAGYIFCDGKCIDWNECSGHIHDPCGQRGKYINHDGGFSCACLEGWNETDKRCSTNLTDHPNCMPGYHGDLCQTAICGDHGYPDPLGIDENYTCVCEEGWMRVSDSANATCDLDIDECVETPGICQHGSSCLNSNGSYTCLCNNEWYGYNCTQYNYTYGGCANSGVCINESCSCSMMWSGENCSLMVNESMSADTSVHVHLSTPKQSVETEEQGNNSSTPFLVAHDNQTSTQFIVAHDNQTSMPYDVAHDKKTLTRIVVWTISGIFLVGLVMVIYCRLKIKKRTAPSFA